MHDRKLVTDYLADRINAVHGNLVWGTYHENHHESKKESRTAWTTVDRRYVCIQVGVSSLAGGPPPGSGPLRIKNSWKQSVAHTHTVPQSALCNCCVKRFFVQQLCTHSADIGAPEDY